MGEVVDGPVSRLRRAESIRAFGCLATNLARDLGGVSLEHSGRLLVRRLLGGQAAVWVQVAGDIPPVLQDLHEVADDRDLDPAPLGLVLDPLDLVAVAVDPRDPGAAVSRVAPVGFVERAGDHCPPNTAPHNLPESDSRALQLRNEMEPVRSRGRRRRPDA